MTSLRGILLAPIGLLLACHPNFSHADLSVGDQLPSTIVARSPRTVVFVTTLEACFSCRLQGGFVALRSGTHLSNSSERPSLTALLVTEHPGDSAILSQSLIDERLDAQIQTLTRSEAGRLFDLDRIPAIYLVENGTVVREWESDERSVVVLDRKAIANAVSRSD